MGRTLGRGVSHAGDRSRLFWAVIEHYRWWFSSDAVWRREIERDRGLTGATCRKIAVAYGVGRGVPRQRENKLAQLLQQQSANWPEGLSDRADFCVDVARKAKRRKLTQKLQCSAISKLMWFLRPEGWTMFDFYAANGLRIGHREDSSRRMQAFYERLESRDFRGVAAQIGGRINSSEFRYLWPERVLDKYLMQYGRGPESNDAKNLELACYLQVLRKGDREGLVALADAIVQAVGEDPLRLAN